MCNIFKRMYFTLMCVGALCAVQLFCISTSRADEQMADSGAPLGKAETKEALEVFLPMDVTGFESRLARALTGFYEKSYGGAEEWKTLESLKYKGRLEVESAVFKFVAYKKKPDFNKIVLIGPSGQRLVTAYDGSSVWREAPTAVEPMSSAEKANFRRDGVFDSHLLYPNKEGKQVELLGTARLGEDLCYEIKVTLESGDVIEYLLDATAFVERQQKTVNNVSGKVEVVTHSDFRKVGSVVVPHVSVMESEGAVMHTIYLSEVSVNKGVMPWMFTR